MTWQILTGDCVEQMRTLEDCSIDAVVCDPPYGIRFMGATWDGAAIEAEMRARAAQAQPAHKDGSDRENPRESRAEAAGKYDLSISANRAYQAWCELWARECLRVLRPGGHLLASCGSRTYQRMACGIEDAGFEIRDSIMWLYGSGFPKSLDVSKAIDKAAGAKREVVGEEPDRWTQKGGVLNFATDRPQDSIPVTGSAVTEAAQRWEGWGTALKPAHEPIVVARKPLIGTVAANVLEHGVGGLNIDACRLDPGEGGERDGEETADKIYENGIGGAAKFTMRPGPRGGSADGRWAANVVLDPEAAATLDEQTGELVSGAGAKNNRVGSGWEGGDLAPLDTPTIGGDSGGASRFFYCAKTSGAERDAGLAVGLPRTKNPRKRYQQDASERWVGRALNRHPTVKPIRLMRWLLRLVTPPGGVVLDPFAGSGTTGKASVLEGLDFIGIERERQYVEYCLAGITFWAQHVGREVDDVLGLVSASEREKKRHDDAGQGSIFDHLEPEQSAA